MSLLCYLYIPRCDEKRRVLDNVSLLFSHLRPSIALCNHDGTRWDHHSQTPKRKLSSLINQVLIRNSINSKLKMHGNLTYPLHCMEELPLRPGLCWVLNSSSNEQEIAIATTHYQSTAEGNKTRDIQKKGEVSMTKTLCTVYTQMGIKYQYGWVHATQKLSQVRYRQKQKHSLTTSHRVRAGRNAGEQATLPRQHLFRAAVLSTNTKQRQPHHLNDMQTVHPYTVREESQSARDIIQNDAISHDAS